MTDAAGSLEELGALDRTTSPGVARLHELVAHPDPRVRFEAFHLLDRDNLVEDRDVNAVLLDWRETLAKGAVGNTEYQVFTFLDALAERGEPRLPGIVQELLADFGPPYQRAARRFAS